MTGLLYLLFFSSGLSGLVYQVVWVRVFGNVFGNTVYSTSLVVAVFMLGLGAGSYLAGAWADRRYAAKPDAIAFDRAGPRPASETWRPDGLLRAYGYFELMIGGSGLGVSLLLPHLDRFSALVSSYSREPSGWYVLSTTSYVARAGIAVVLLTPITILMGGTLTLLIRHLVRQDVDSGGRRIAALYGVNTAGAALGAFLTDFALVPSLGLRGTQLVAVVLNLLIGIGALWIARRDEQTFRREVGQQHPMVPDTTYGGPGAARKRGKSRGVRVRLPAKSVPPADVAPFATKRTTRRQA